MCVYIGINIATTPIIMGLYPVQAITSFDADPVVFLYSTLASHFNFGHNGRTFLYVVCLYVFIFFIVAGM